MSVRALSAAVSVRRGRARRAIPDATAHRCDDAPEVAGAFARVDEEPHGIAPLRRARRHDVTSGLATLFAFAASITP
ncbi:MAG TPA: hypothetical protein VFS55_05675 [Dokdonella sp.]|nr:hypothetical protein [Dokdonella sp.]